MDSLASRSRRLVPVILVAAFALLGWQDVADADPCGGSGLPVKNNPFLDKCERWSSDYFTGAQYFDSPKETCGAIKAAADPNMRDRWSMYRVNDDLWTAVRNGSNYTQIIRATRDSCCDAQPAGPYKDLSDAWGTPVYTGFGWAMPMSFRFRGAAFQYDPQKLLIRQTNWSRNSGAIRSDLWSVPELAGVDYACAGNQLEFDFTTDDCSPEIHHIVPRKDSKGCDCGRNTYRNAVLITRKLNQEIGNDCTNPKLLAILNYYAMQAAMSEAAAEKPKAPPPE